MTEKKKTYEYELRGKKLIVEIGEIAKQASAGILVYYGETVVISAAQVSNQAKPLDFFPLTVVYQEKLYAAGKIPGSFLKREGRPTEREILAGRAIDRPIRPLFDEGFRNEVQLINYVLSHDPDCSPEMTAVFGSSLALSISCIPFNGPIAAVVVGRINGEFIINPTPEELLISDIDLTVAGTFEAINMVEAGAKEVTEEDMLNAILFGHEEIKKLIQFQLKIQKDIGLKKMDLEVFNVDEKVAKEVVKFASKDLIKAIKIKDKLERYAKIDEIKANATEHFEQTVFTKQLDKLTVLDEEAKKAYLKTVKITLDKIEKDEVRRLITADKVRPDGRKSDEIRPLTSRVGLLPRTHGSGLFTRGQTQCLSVVTLGAKSDNQRIDGLDEDLKRFMLHYNFPAFSVGETGRYMAPGRREVGHGALGEKALLQVMPDEMEFPYTIRVVSEILESNGSTSQASICAGTMALMDAGVPIKAPVAGIAMGLIMDGKDYTILTDIQGMEDHLGDMDFKVAGTEKGITALQMDIKIDGITTAILKESLAQAKSGRLDILKHMKEVIPTVRPELSKYAPKVKVMMIDPEKIKEVIGSGGKIITKIIEECNNVTIDIEQNGKIYIMHSEMLWIDKAIAKIESLTKSAEVGVIYTGKVVRIEKFGCFVELWPGCEGLVHISKLAKEKVETVESVVSLGDEILVKCIKIDEKGRVDLSRKDAM